MSINVFTKVLLIFDNILFSVNYESIESLMLSLHFFTIQDDDVVDLMRWGKTLTTLRGEEAIISLNEENITAEFMVIPEQKFDDLHELVIMGTISNGSTKPANMRRKVNRDHREITHRLLTKLEEPPDNFNLAGAGIVYFLVSRHL